MAEWTHRFIAAKPFNGGPTFIKVTAGLHHLRGNARPHFSVTAETRDSGGCLHDDVLRYWPELRPVVALHLSDDRGVPLHAEANSWYQFVGYYGGLDSRYHAGNATPAKSPAECIQSFADYVRIPLAEAIALADYLRAEDSPESMRRWFGAWILAQFPRWQAEADAAIAVLDSLIAAQSQNA